MVTRIEILGKNLHVDGNSLFPTLVLLLQNYGKTFTNILSLSLSLPHAHMHTCTHTYTHTQILQTALLPIQYISFLISF